MTNLLEKKKQKKRFLESKHHSFLGRNNSFTQKMESNKSSSSVNEIFHSGTKVLNEILDKWKTHGDKRGLGHINKDETLSNREIIFVKRKKKRKKETPTK